MNNTTTTTTTNDHSHLVRLAGKSDTFAVTEAGPWRGLSPIKIEEVKEPSHHWTGGKIGRELWQQILAFLKWSYDETKSETVVHLFYHEADQKWDALVLPQEGYCGMTVKLLDEHPNRIPTYRRLGKGWKNMGTVHHHCSSSAFQSGTDSSDEKTKEGLHITIGCLNSLRYDIHARTSFRQVMFDHPDLSEWFDIVMPEVRRGVPAYWMAKLTEWTLCEPAPAGTAFPDWWKDNVIKVERSWQRPAMPFHQGTGVWTKTTSGEWVLATADDILKSNTTASDPMEEAQLQFCAAIRDIRDDYKVELGAIQEMLREIQQDFFLTDVVDALAASGLTVREAILELSDLMGDEEDEAEAKANNLRLADDEEEDDSLDPTEMNAVQEWIQ